MLTNVPHEHKPLLVLSGLVLVMLALFLGFKTWLTLREAMQVGKPMPYEYTINIEGTGEAKVKPDVGTISFGVVSQKPTLPEAQNDNTQRMNGLLQHLMTLGIEKNDIQTSVYTSYENSVYDNTGLNYKSYGWVVSQSVDVTIRELDKISSVFTLLGQNGVSNISGPNFSVENNQAAVNEAREKALADAKQKVDAIAKQLGIDLGTLSGYSEWQGGGQDYGYTMKAEDMGALEPTVEPGQNTVKVHVSLGYLIKR